MSFCIFSIPGTRHRLFQYNHCSCSCVLVRRNSAHGTGWNFNLLSPSEWPSSLFRVLCLLKTNSHIVVSPFAIIGRGCLSGTWDLVWKVTARNTFQVNTLTLRNIHIIFICVWISWTLCILSYSCVVEPYQSVYSIITNSRHVSNIPMWCRRRKSCLIVLCIIRCSVFTKQ